MSGIFQNKQAIIIKFLFFITFAALASWASYFYIFLKEIPKLSGVEIGIIAGLQQFNYIYVVPLWGLLADKFGRKNILLITAGVTLLILPGFLLFNGAVGFIFFIFLVTLFLNPIISLLDTIALDYEEQVNGRITYGEIRLWASVGWAASSFFSGLFINNDNLMYIFPIASGLYLIMWLVLFIGYKPLKIKKNLKPIDPRIIKTLLTSERKLLLFFAVLFIYSVLSAPIYLIINIYYHEIGASTSLIGLAFAIQSVSELPFFFYGKKLITRFGPSKVFLFAMFATALRMLAYGFTSNPNIAMAIGVVHGISIGLFFVSVVAFVHRIVPAEMRSTGPGLIYTFYAGGVAFGNLLTGILEDLFSVKLTMAINGIAIILLVIIVFVQLNKRIEKPATI